MVARLAAVILVCCGVPRCVGASFEFGGANSQRGERAGANRRGADDDGADARAEARMARKLETAYVERPVFLPPEAKKLVLGGCSRMITFRGLGERR